VNRYVRITIEEEDERETVELRVVSETASWLVGQEISSRGIPEGRYRRVESVGDERVIDRRTIIAQTELRYDPLYRTLRPVA